MELAMSSPWRCLIGFTLLLNAPVMAAPVCEPGMGYVAADTAEQVNEALATLLLEQAEQAGVADDVCLIRQRSGSSGDSAHRLVLTKCCYWSSCLLQPSHEQSHLSCHVSQPSRAPARALNRTSMTGKGVINSARDV